MLAVRFRQHFPLVEISMLSCRPSDVDGLLRDGKADLAVASFEAASTDLECQFFFSGHIILIAPSDHPRVANAKIQPDDLTGEAMIIREPTSGTRRALLSDWTAHNISLVDLKIMLELGNAESIVAAIAAGIGVSFVSRTSTDFVLEARSTNDILVLPHL